MITQRRPRIFHRIAMWAALLMLAGCTPFLSRPMPEFREVLLQGEGRDKILLIDISGVISNTPFFVPNVGLVPGMTARVRQELEIAFDDPLIRGVLLRINSPGGTLTDSDIIYHSLVEFKKSKKVKIVAALGDIAASGALYLAMAADEIYAHPTTLTGSIGVIMPHIDLSGVMDRLGIKSDPIKSGKFKDIDSEFRPRTDEERKMLQKLIDHQHKKFVAAIRAGRKNMTKQQVQAIADGRLLTAQDAKARGLVDEIGYLDNAYERISRISGFPANRLVRYANAWMTGNNIYSNAFPIELNQF
ncbi:MAG: signal peptide peptidase SppA [SAR324 cluster bacterium]|nr:signal peptide peptidase SppA [SAR324 cluster bacterium]